MSKLMESLIEIQPSLKKQDVVIADHSGTAHLTLWQKDFDSLDEGESYDIKICQYGNLTVQSISPQTNQGGNSTNVLILEMCMQ